MFGFDDHQDLGSEQVVRAVSGTIYYQLAENQNWNGTSLLKCLIDIRTMDSDNFTEPLNVTEVCLSDDILDVFINPQLQMKTEVLTLHFFRIQENFDFHSRNNSGWMGYQH